MSRSILNTGSNCRLASGLDGFGSLSHLRTNIEFSSRDEDIKTISVTSALPGEGKSTIAANIAVAYAQAKRRVLIIDANLRNPAQHELFGLLQHHGLSTVLTKRSELDDVIQRTNIEQSCRSYGRTLPANPSELLESISMTDLLETSKERFDIVISIRLRSMTCRMRWSWPARATALYWS